MNDKEKNYELIKFEDGDFSLDVKVSPTEDTVWLTQNDIALLLNTTKQNISLHMNNILRDGELEEYSTVKDFLIVQDEGGRKINRNIRHYNLDMILAVGYRVKSSRGNLFRKWANSILKQYLLNGYVINKDRVIAYQSNILKLEASFIDIENRLNNLEDKVFDKQYGLDKLFFNGQFYDAYTLIQSIFEKANNEIIIIDNYIDRSILDRLVVKKIDVKVIIYTNINTSKINDIDINTFNKQYNNLKIVNTSKVHDRFITIDKIKLYHLGASIKDLGKKIFSINELDNCLIKELLNHL